MKIIDVIGKPCPIPVIEAKKALAAEEGRSVLVKVDNFVAVQNLEKMAKGLGYEFAFAEISGDRFEVSIGEPGDRGGDTRGALGARDIQGTQDPQDPQGIQDIQGTQDTSNGLVVAIGRDTMGAGEPELGKILIKGFIYSLSELPAAPAYVIFYNSGAYLTAACANTIDDLKNLETKGTKILTCGTCVDYYNLEPPAAGGIANMYEIVGIMSNASRVIGI